MRKTVFLITIASLLGLSACNTSGKKSEQAASPPSAQEQPQQQPEQQSSQQGATTSEQAEPERQPASTESALTAEQCASIVDGGVTQEEQPMFQDCLDQGLL